MHMKIFHCISSQYKNTFKSILHISSFFLFIEFWIFLCFLLQFMKYSVTIFCLMQFINISSFFNWMNVSINFLIFIRLFCYKFPQISYFYILFYISNSYFLQIPWLLVNFYKFIPLQISILSFITHFSFYANI